MTEAIPGADGARRPDRQAGVPLWLHVRDDMRRRCESGHFADGVPGEVHLAAEYGVSRHTIREALRDLRASGLLSSRRGRGTVVLPAVTPHVRPAVTVTDPDVAERLGLPGATVLIVTERVIMRDGRPAALDRSWRAADEPVAYSAAADGEGDGTAASSPDVMTIPPPGSS